MDIAQPQKVLRYSCAALALVAGPVLAQDHIQAAAPNNTGAKGNGVTPLKHKVEPAGRVEQVIVTGTRTPKTREDSPVPVDIITAKDLQMVTSGTVADALAFIPGVVMSRTPKGGYTVMMQGFDSDRVLVLVDGLPLISPTGESVDLDQISANDIARIEIVRGAASVLYGSSAMGGVINILTKDYTGNGLRFSGELGSYGDYALDNNNKTQDYVATAHAELNKWNVKLTGQWLDRPGFKYEPDARYDDAGSVEKQFVNLQIRKSFKGVKLVYQPQYFEESKEKAVGLLPDRATNYYRSKVTQVQHDLSIVGGSSWQVKARINEHEEPSGQITSRREATINNRIVDAQKLWVTPHAEIVAGFKYSDQAITQKKGNALDYEIDNERYASEAFAQIDFLATNEWNLVAGARGQSDSDFGGHSALRVNSLWSPKLLGAYNFKWRSSLGEGYRVPSIKERFYVFDHSNLGYIVIGNVALKPETSLSLNNHFSWEVPFTKSPLVFEASAHYSLTDNFIESARNDEQSSEQKLDVYEYQNLSKAKIYGADLSLGQTSSLRWQLNYAYLEAYDDTTGERLEGRPRHQLKANIWLPIGEKQEVLFFGTYEADSYDQRTILDKSYALFNVRWSWQARKNIKWKIGVDNIANTHRLANIDEEIEYDITPISSRYIFTTLEYSL